MSVRDMTINDLLQLEGYAQFPLEFLINKPKIVQKTFEDENGLIGTIIVTGTVELSAIFNGRSKRDKIKTMKLIYDILYKELNPLGYRDLHTFIRDPEFAEILVNHFNFEPVIGRALVRRY